MNLPHVLVRNIEEDVLNKLKERVKENSRSLQTELKMLFAASVFSTSVSDIETAERIKNTLRGRRFSDSAESLQEERAR